MVNLFLLIFLACFDVTLSSHFRGATISWKPSDQEGQILVSYRISWRRSQHNFCMTQDDIKNKKLVSGEGDLIIRAPPGKRWPVTEAKFVCTDFSISEDWATGELSDIRYNYTVLDSPYFHLGFSGGGWVPLVYGGGRWEVWTMVNVSQQQKNGKINSSPVTSTAPVVRVQQNCESVINIQVVDPDNDFIRCRMAEGSGECGGICKGLRNAILDGESCKLKLQPQSQTGLYGVAIQIEDYKTPLDKTPMSSVALQFIINVYQSNANCSSSPKFSSLTRPDKSSVDIPFNGTYSEILFATTGTTEEIQEFVTASPSGMQKSAVMKVGENSSFALEKLPAGASWYYVNITWKPTNLKVSKHIFCFSAVGTTQISTEQRCITLVVGGQIQSRRFKDYCEETTYGSSDYKGEYKFPETSRGTTYSTNCVYNKAKPAPKLTRMCMGHKNQDAYWGLIIDFEKCEAKFNGTNELLNLNKTTICSNNEQQCESISNVSSKLKEVLETQKIQIVEEVKLVADVLDDIANNINVVNNSKQAQKVVDDVITSVSKLLEKPTKLLGESEIKTNSSAQILKSLDNLAKNFNRALEITNNTNTEMKFEKAPNVAFSITRSKFATDVYIIARQKLKNAYVNITTNSSEAKITASTLSIIKIPKQLFNNSKEAVYSYYFKQDSLFQNENQLKKINGDQTKINTFVDSNILSATVGFRNIKNSPKNIVLTFKKSNTEIVHGDHDCSFWNPQQSTSIPGVLGGWSSKGCKRSKRKTIEGYITCECDHLTNFALLLDITQTGINTMELSVITRIGCGVSLLGLFITILAHSYFRKLRQKLCPKILISFCTSLALLLIVFLSGSERTSNKITCKTVAAILHYLILSTFSWMAVEAANLYKKFVKVFSDASGNKFFVVSSVIAWGTPVIVVAITLAVFHKFYGNEYICMIHGIPFYITVVTPVAVILIVNTTILVIVMKKLQQHARNVKKKGKKYGKKGKKSALLADARIAFTCNVLLGITWIFAYLAVGKATMLFEWLFTIFNSLQGFFIFIFYVARNAELRKMLHKEKCFNIKEKILNNSYVGKNSGDFTSSSTVECISYHKKLDSEI